MKIILKTEAKEVFDLVADKLGEKNIYLVGGFVRDYLLERESTDMDFATPLDPNIVFSLFPYSLYFKKFGTVSFKIGKIHVTIASFRKEENYLDYRHPSKVTFVTSLKVDSKRRDFSINALYADSKLDVLDPTHHGLRDLKKKRLNFIGNSKRRIQEDPLRIMRAYRFREELGFTFTHALKKAILKKKDLLSQLNPQKIEEELRKVDSKEARDAIIEELDLIPLLNKKEEKK